MGLGLKSKFKKTLYRKEYIPIAHPVSTKNEFNGRVALISGGSGGIGLSIAKSLRESGCDVVVAGTNEKKLSRIKDELGFDIVVMDYLKPDTFNSVISEVIEKHNRINIFISSTGVHTENIDFWSMNSSEFDRIININLKGAFFACQSIGKYMKDNKIKGSILLVSSSRGSEPAWSPYGISK